MNASLILANGRVFRGTGFGARREAVFAMVFNTSMTGCQELLTNPSCCGQGIVMSYPLIGNCGANSEDVESSRPWAEALIVRRLSPHGSNFRCETTLGEYLTENDVAGIQGVDTRALTRILRDEGSMNALITYDENLNPDEKLEILKNFKIEDPVSRVSRTETEVIEGPGPRVAVLDLGVKNSTLRALRSRGCHLTILPADSPASLILSGNYDGALLAGGPGDPSERMDIAEQIGLLRSSGLPLFGIGLGHQLMALSAGFGVEKLPCGHRGANQPVRDLASDRVYISAQNHEFAVSRDSVDGSAASVSHININDGSVEGLLWKGGGISVQFCPDSLSGPTSTSYLFDRFLDMMGGTVNAQES